MVEIEHGFYWIKENDEDWTIAEYDGRWWFIGGDDSSEYLGDTYIIHHERIVK